MYNLIEVFLSAVTVPSIINRRRIPKKAIDDVIRQIAEKFEPEKIILFGSYARGNPRPESDVDLLVVMDTPLREVQQEILIQQSLEMDLFGLDLIVQTPRKLQERVALGDSFLREILRDGIVVYEAIDA
jgi:predicted nucleotidyltransferase